ncbi:MAG: hypothetical protein J7J72_10320 [Bacteroidales bacterium]|nr:hypothetical protein [Bacteroidales bacterium]
MENLTLSKTSLNWVYDAARWARFISILGFILLTFLVIVGIFIGPILSMLNDKMDIASSTATLSGGLIAAIYIAIAVIYFFPIFYLFQFSHGFIKAYKAENEESLNNSFRFLKKHYTFIGIMLIVVIVLYIVLFVGSMLALMF